MRMKKGLFIAFISIMAMPMMLFGQSYKQLWKQVGEAQDKDLPQQVIKHAEQIMTKARKEKQYGHLLKAQLTAMETQFEVAPDSLKPWVKRMEQELRRTQDGALRAVYATVLCRLYSENGDLLGDSSYIREKEYRTLALENPALLARTKAKTFDPYVVKEKDSRYFGDDLLSLIGRTLKRYDEMHAQYVVEGNRAGACLSALWLMQEDRPYTGDWKTSEYITKLDSLISEYGDLDVCAELALERYDYMSSRGHATEQERLDYIHEATKRWAKWPSINILRNAEQTMTNPQFEVRLASELINSSTAPEVTIEDVRNVEQLTMRIYKTNLTGEDNVNLTDDDDWKALKKHLTLLPERTQTRNYAGRAPFEEFEDSMLIEPLPLGVYLLEFTAGELTVRDLLYVSNLFVLSQPQPSGEDRFEIVDGQTGQPVPGAKLKMRKRRNNTVIYAYTETDKGYRETSAYGSFNFNDYHARKVTTHLYTDRSIYRPGQTLYVAALVHETSKYIETRAVEGKEVTLRLRDANWKVVEEKTVTTDKYGKASAEFILPKDRLTGRYSVEAGDSRQYFRVEEYKRPTYEVLFDEVTETYKAGDTLAVVGQARSYAGVGVQGATVKYTVKRRIAFWWLSYSYYWEQGAYGYGRNDTEITSGTLTTDNSGHFTVNVPLTLPANHDDHPMFYYFVVETDVTDQAGESHTGSTSVPLGTRQKVLTCDLAEKVLKEEFKGLTFHLRNAAGNSIEGKTVRFRLDGGEWQEVKTNSQLSTLDSQLNSGLHTLEAACEGETLKQEFTVFSLDDTTPCAETKDWFYASATQFPNDGTPVTIQVGSSDENVHLFYSIFAGEKVIESGAVDLSNALWNKKFTYKEEYGTGLLLTFAWVKEGEVYTHQTTIKRPVPDKKLTLRWETFRDRLTPGQKEEWKLVVTNPDGTPADAQLMATLYDKSLDQLYPHQWSFAPYMTIPTPSTSWNHSSWGRIYGHAAHEWEPLEVKGMRFSHFDYIGWQLLGFEYYDEDALNEVVVVGYGTAKRRLSRNVMVEDGEPMMMASMAAEPMARETEEPAPEADNAEEPAAEEEEAAVPMRENLNETAFFYPTLTTDSEGRIAIKFTLPESLTTWRFMGIATTQDMCNGYIGGEAVAQKEVMIQPNMPRFLRAGDQAKLSARIFNTSDHAVSGTSMLRLLDPETNKVILKQSQPFTVKAGEMIVVTFDIALSTLNSQLSTLFVCQMSASGKNFSDGEQHYLAVLPNEERVTVTVPFTQHEPGTKTIDIAKLFPAGTGNQKLTVEYTNNPAWLMVQALPSVGNPNENNAIDQAAWLYSNLIARTLIKQSDNIKTVFEQWKREPANDASLTAQLAKNEELKDILLQETPWVIDADRETEQKQRLADFFDENTMDNRISEATKKLRALQNGNGSWSWWPGMEGSFYMTVSITEMLTRLNVMAGKQQETASMLNNAFKFMGKEIVDDVKKMKKWEKENGKDYGFPSFKALQYLYICALDGRELPKDVKAANEYLIAKMKKDIKNQTIYEKALSAIILQKIGERKRSAEYAQSLKEYTVFTEEKGRYYDTPRAGYSWYDYKIPTEVMAIEALKVITPEDEQTVEEMQRWLLQEKRTQAWDTPINSVNAIWAFLDNQNTLNTQSAQTVLAIDGRPLDLPKATAGIGYVKTAIEQPKGKLFTAKKTSTGTSWGAVYAQFMQPVRDIETSASGLTIKREIIIQNTPSTQNTPITLKVGDKVTVRLTIESERDLDFVQVLDRRAACMEPVRQLSGYRNGAYCSPKDYSTNYYFDRLPKGKRVIETEYYIDRAGTYETGTCTIQCAYAPEYRATAKAQTLNVQ